MKRFKLAILLLATLSIGQAAHAQMEEQVVKAAYIYNFLRLTQWPIAPKHPFNLCILGETPLDDELHLLEGQPVRSDVYISIKHVSIVDDVSNCHAIYINYRNRKQIDMVLSRLSTIPALTISDADGVADRGVMIELSTKKHRVAFEINLKAARYADINFNTRLLKLASFVTTH